jgi:flagellar motility protein MotE (MotC chaperone)
MMKLLQSGWAAGLVGALLYLSVTVALVTPSKLVLQSAQAAEAEESHVTGPSWEFINPELDRLVSELAKEKETLTGREKQLNELAARLEAERQEINIVTQAVYRMQTEFDRNVVRVREEEMANLKKLAKVYAAMSPEGAAAILKQMEDEQILKFMVFMKDAETGPVLESLAKLGETDAKRAATLTEKLRTTLFRNAAPKAP